MFCKISTDVRGESRASRKLHSAQRFAAGEGHGELCQLGAGCREKVGQEGRGELLHERCRGVGIGPVGGVLHIEQAGHAIGCEHIKRGLVHLRLAIFGWLIGGLGAGQHLPEFGDFSIDAAGIEFVLCHRRPQQPFVHALCRHEQVCGLRG